MGTPVGGWAGRLERGRLVHELDLPPAPGNRAVVYPPEYLAPYAPDDREAAHWTTELEDLVKAGERRLAKEDA